MDAKTVIETELSIGPRAIDAYSRLNYTMWYALAEFIDKTTNRERTTTQLLTMFNHERDAAGRGNQP